MQTVAWLITGKLTEWKASSRFLDSPIRSSNYGAARDREEWIKSVDAKILCQVDVPGAGLFGTAT